MAEPGIPVILEVVWETDIQEEDLGDGFPVAHGDEGGSVELEEVDGEEDGRQIGKIYGGMGDTYGSLAPWVWCGVEHVYSQHGHTMITHIDTFAMTHRAPYPH